MTHCTSSVVRSRTASIFLRMEMLHSTELLDIMADRVEPAKRSAHGHLSFVQTRLPAPVATLLAQSNARVALCRQGLHRLRNGGGLVLLSGAFRPLLSNSNARHTPQLAG